MHRLGPLLGISHVLTADVGHTVHLGLGLGFWFEWGKLLTLEFKQTPVQLGWSNDYVCLIRVIDATSTRWAFTLSPSKVQEDYVDLASSPARYGCEGIKPLYPLNTDTANQSQVGYFTWSLAYMWSGGSAPSSSLLYLVFQCPSAGVCTTLPNSNSLIVGIFIICHDLGSTNNTRLLSGWFSDCTII